MNLLTQDTYAKPNQPNKQTNKTHARVVPDDVPPFPQALHVNQLHVALQAREPPVVLVLEIGACGLGSLALCGKFFLNWGLTIPWGPRWGKHLAYMYASTIVHHHPTQNKHKT